MVNRDKSGGPYYLSPLGKYVTNSFDFQNFQFKNLDPKLNPSHLALMDFVERGLKNIIVFANTNEIEHMKKFYQHYAEKMKIEHIVRIVYNKSNFNAVISLDSAFWQFTDLFSNDIYDQIKVLEFNARLMDYIEV
ncbi:MAG: hypothetical protein HZR80_00810 [Candidatus Heimdallarchaeota archaeon]